MDDEDKVMQNLIKFIKPQRGEGSCQSVTMEQSECATCLRSSHMTDITSDETNGVCESGGGMTKMREVENAGAIEASYHKGIGANEERTGVTDGLRIRRLTPKECWRLQGFTDEQFDKAKAAGVSDSQLYKQAGNAISVNIAYAIGLALNKEAEHDTD